MRPPAGAKDSVSTKTHLNNIWKSTGRKPKELDEHGDCPENLAYIWGWYCELQSPVNYTELAHWQSIMRRSLSHWEAELLISIDRMVKHG